jgi:hypothetical protein
MITQVIPPQGFELIRDRICQILLAELNNQYLMTYDEDLNLSQIFMERMVPFSHAELPALNVGMERGDYVAYHQGQADGVYRFFIECNTQAATTEEARGDERAKRRAQRLLGKCRYILEDPIYKKLGFASGLISHRHVESFVFAEPTRHDLENVTMTRMILVVKSVETNEKIVAAMAESWDTTVKLGVTDHGYYWSKEEITP